MAEKDIILKLKVDGDKALQAVKQYTEKVESLRRTQTNLKQAMQEVEEQRKALIQSYEEGTMSVEDYHNALEEVQKSEDGVREKLAMNKAELDNTSQTLRGYQKELQNVVKQQEALANGEDGSLASLRAELSNATKAFDNLSREEREGAKGTELLDHINEITDKLKEAEEATQRYYRNVGNYKSALEGAEKATEGLKDGVLGFVTAGNPMLQMLINTSMQLGSVKQAFVLARQGAVMLGKQMLALMANPIVAFLAVIATAFITLKKGIESSDERMNKFKALMAPLQGAIDGVVKIIGYLADGFLAVIEATSDAFMWLSKIAEYIPYLGDKIREGNKATKEYIEIELQKQEITKRSREMLVKTAERERDISELRAKYAEKDKYNNKERLAFLDQAIALERKQAEDEKRMAELKYENLQREAAMSENNAEMNDRLAEAKAEVIRADKNLSDALRELNAQRAEAVNAINAEAEAERRKAEEAERKRQEEARRWAEEAKRRREEAKRNREEAKNKEVEAIRAAEDAITAIIKDNIVKRKREAELEYQRNVEDIQERLKTETNLTKTAREALNKQLVLLKIKYNQDIRAIDEEVAAGLKAKEAEELQAQKEARATAQQELIEERATYLNTELELIKQKNLSELEEQKAMLEAKISAKHVEIATMQQMEDESNEEFYLRQLEAQNALTELNEQHKEKNVKIAEEEAKKKREAYNDVMKAMSAMGEHSKALGKVAKIMGLAQIAVDTGKAISAGVASAMAVPFPANLAAIATTVATVLTNMATAISSIKSAKFATGGLVEGAGSGTSDSIPAMLSNGESVMTAQATSAFAPLLSTLNQMGGGVPIQATSIGSQQMGEDMLARAVARGVAEIQPVVSVEEINRVSANVKVIESLATI